MVEDPLLNEWDRAIKEAEEKGDSVAQSKGFLNIILDAKIYTLSSQEIVKENMETLKGGLASHLLRETTSFSRG